MERSLDSAKEEREAFIQEIVEEVKGHIDRAGIKAEIDGVVEWKDAGEIFESNLMLKLR